MKSVDKGAALLDERLPGWRDEVDPVSLKLESNCGCVLGQIFDSYDRGIELLGVNGQEYGFMRHPRGSWKRLTEAWRRKLRA